MRLEEIDNILLMEVEIKFKQIFSFFTNKSKKREKKYRIARDFSIRGNYTQTRIIMEELANLDHIKGKEWLDTYTHSSDFFYDYYYGTISP